MSIMSFDYYQEQARKTAIYPDRGNNITYPTLGLCGEAGEFAEKVKKTIRDDCGIVTDEKRVEMVKELGDVLWYVANICSELHLSMEEVARANLEKLKSRADRGAIKGSGDNR